MRYSSADFNWGAVAQTGIMPAGAHLLQDTWSFKVDDVKPVITESAGGRKGRVTRVTGLFQMADLANANFRVYPMPVLREAVDNIQKEIAKHSVWGEYDHPCWGDITNLKVLCVGGWRRFSDLKVGDRVWSRVDGKMVQSCVTQIVDEPYDGIMYRVRGKSIDTMLTPGHKMVLTGRPDKEKADYQFYATIEDIYNNRRKYRHNPIPRTAKWTGNVSPTFTIPGTRRQPEPLVLDTLKFAAFMGLYLSEGHTKHNVIYISQVSENGRKLISDFLASMHPELKWNENKHSFYTSDSRLAAYLKPLGTKYTKYIPDTVKNLDVPYLEELIHWFAVGDGRMLSGQRDEPWLSVKDSIGVVEPRLRLKTYSRVAVFSVSERLIDDLHECVVKTGRCGKKSVILPKRDYIFADHLIKAENKKPLYQLHISRLSNIFLDPRFTAIEPVNHTGRIHCISVEHGNFYVEENNCTYWTGNCDAKINLDRISHLITKIWMDGKSVYGAADIMEELPFGAQLKVLLEHGSIGISSRGVGDMDVRETANGEESVVLPGYRFITWDAVAEPSVSGAQLHITEGKNRRITRRSNRNNSTVFDKTVYESALVKEIKRQFGI